VPERVNFGLVLEFGDEEVCRKGLIASAAIQLVNGYKISNYIAATS
jgi:hypothetical protein